tara:strand:- start:88 stop:954 length:867 start_codon:yes stop_codon:yes gene_type:complete
MSVRNNEDRLGHRDLGDTSPTPQAHQGSQSSVFSFVVPTEMVVLPSGGKYYPEDHPLYNTETIEVKHMTAKEEDILTSKSLLKKGIAINRVLQSVIVDKGVDVNSLLIGDKNAIIVATRIHAYGPKYETNVTCPACSATVKHSFDLAEVGYDHDAQEIMNMDFVSNKGNNFVITLPKTQARVEVRLLNGKDEKLLADALSMKRKHNLPETMLTDQFRTYIVSVNESSDKENINSFVSAVPASDSRFLRTVYDKLVPNINMTQNFICTSCDYDAEMEVPLNADFFWPKQ